VTHITKSTSILSISIFNNIHLHVYAYFKIIMMDTTDLQLEINKLHAEICSALADPHRILMFYVLADKYSNVSDLAAQVGISQPAASRHLKIMRERGLVHTVRKGQNVEYRLSDIRLIQALDLLRSVLRAQLQDRADLIQVLD
jgi:DNA-binding transcriptional ArsR family regulator